MTDKIKVVVSALYYPMGMYRYFLSALQRREDVEVCTVGPMFGTWIPWNGGMQLPGKYVCNPDIPIPSNLNQCAVQAVENRLPWQPDLWLQIDAGFHFTGKPKHGINAHVYTDPHCLMPHYLRVRRDMDVVFNMQTPYINSGDEYLPYAFDPTVHYPEQAVMEYDACLIGLHYEQRNQLVSRCKSKGLKVYYDLGPIFDEYRKLNNQSFVALCWSSLQDMPARVWEAFGMAMPLVTNRMPDLSHWFVEGEDYLGFATAEEGAAKAYECLRDRAMAQEMAQKAYKKVVKDHTWDHRIQQILDTVKL